MRRGSCALGVLFFIAGHAAAAEPGNASAPAVSAAPTAVKPAPAPPKAGAAPPAEYYVEPSAPPSDAAPPAGVAPAAEVPASPGAAPPSTTPDSGPPGPPPPPPGDANAIYEPPPPGFYPPDGPVFEPPPPPEPHHVAPRTSLWLGARVGWFIPFGSAFARGTRVGDGVNYKGVPWRNYVGSGPMFEIDAGARLSRNYNVFALWERAQLSSGNGDPDDTSVGKSKSGDTDFYGVGVRATSDPDRVGFITELAIGYRRARAKYDGSEIQFTDAPFEARLGIGADIRLSDLFSLSPLVTVGVGSFGKIERASRNGVADQMQRDDQADGHAWATFTIGGNFDLFGSKH